MKRMLAISLILPMSAMPLRPAVATAAPTARTAAELDAALDTGKVSAPFDIEATVTFPCDPVCNAYAIKDATGEIVLRENALWPDCPLKPGDRIRAKGVTDFVSSSHMLFGISTNVAIISHGAPPEPAAIGADELLDGKCDCRLVKIEGTVRDAFRDEIDLRWSYIVLQCGRDSIYACFTSPGIESPELQGLIGAKVAVSGVCTPNNPGARRMIGRLIMVRWPQSLTVLRPAPPDPFDVPALDATSKAHASVISGMERRRTSGRVIAVWRDRHVLLRNGDGGIVRVDLSESKPPRYGDTIEAVGQPETDLYRLNLARAAWRTCRHKAAAEPEAVTVSVKQLLTDKNGRSAVQARYHGKAIRIAGTVRSLPSLDNSAERMGLECDRHIVPIDASACPDALAGVEVGCVLEVSGICLIETENWRPNAPFPHVDGFAVVVRTPDDVRILSRPPWWTTDRLMAIIGALLAALAGVFVWNRSLNRLAERRGRELTEETVARVTANLKVGERTRLAIELHDSLSQNLTGAALEIETSDTLIDSDAPQAHRHLGIAAKTLKSCREELRNCLWDLRNDALGEQTMDAAIRRTLTPHASGIDLAVRFNVPRERLSDDTAHAILRIIRELVQNAARHGRAKTVNVAGGMENARLLFSVQDDGCGFDPDTAPGVRQGHFGLQGIRERINQFGGRMEIESGPGKGTKVTISIKATNYQ